MNLDQLFQSHIAPTDNKNEKIIHCGCYSLGSTDVGWNGDYFWHLQRTVHLCD